MRCLTRAASSGLLQSAHDCSDGGVAITLAECAFDTGGIGCSVDLPLSTSAAATLFGESASRAVVSVTSANLQKLLQLAAGLGVPAPVDRTHRRCQHHDDDWRAVRRSSVRLPKLNGSGRRRSARYFSGTSSVESTMPII